MNLHLLSPRGFRASGVYAGIKSKHASDIGLLVCDALASAAAVFTTNKVFAAPVKVGRNHVAAGKLRGVVVNSGNANACTGRQGERDALRMCAIAAQTIEQQMTGAHAMAEQPMTAKSMAAHSMTAHSMTGPTIAVQPSEILPSSTGIIGHLLPMDKIERGIRDAGQYLGDSLEQALLFADSILTTDLKRKSAAVEWKVGHQRVTLAGVCKGSGMIGPRMVLGETSRSTRKVSRGSRAAASSATPHATMLAYLTTDAQIPPSLLRRLLAEATDASFNAVTVDDHMSTNDTAAILASGASEARIDSPQAIKSFAKALGEVCQSLAYQIAADGEGATKVVIVEVTGASSVQAANAMARAIANSPLVKCAMNGNDPNWGRIVSAAGLAGVPFDPDACTLKLQGTRVFANGRPIPFDAPSVSAALAAAEVRVQLVCRSGAGRATCWTCDLSKDYVTINADYHT